MTDSRRGTEEPGDQIARRLPNDTAADASSRDLGRTLDGEANVAGGRWAPTRPEEPAASEDELDERDAARRDPDG
jgi:hypothetical protein